MKIRFLCIFTMLFWFLIIAPYSFAGAIEERVENSRDVINEIMSIPEKGIPLDLLKHCRAIAIFPNVLKGAFIFGAEGGKGIICAHNPETGQWSPPAFFTIAGGSRGLQAGVESTDFVLVITSKRGLDGLLTSKVKLGGEIAIDAGAVGEMRKRQWTSF